MARHEQGVLISQHCLGHFAATVDGLTPVGLPGLAGINLDKLRRVIIRNVGAQMTWTDDGSTPSAVHGMPALADEVLIYDGSDPAGWLCLATGGTNVDLRVAFYGLN